jgi:hypothetical protein
MTGRAALDAGKRWERDAAKHATARLAAAGIIADDEKITRRASIGKHDDEGDLFGIPGFAIQCKNTGRVDLTVVDEAQQQAVNLGVEFGVLLQKRRQSSAGAAYAVMTFDTLLDIIIKLNRRETDEDSLP